MKLQKGQNGWYLTQTGYEDRHVVDWTDSPERTALNRELRRGLWKRESFSCRLTCGAR